MTLSGLFGECSARPISSKYIIEIILSKFFSLAFKIFLAVLKIFNTPFEVDPNEPWKALMNNFGKDLNKKLSEESPCIALNKS